MEWVRDGRATLGVGDVILDGDVDCASLIARGKYPKSYRYTDPNEDALSVATRTGGATLAVADGHRGWIASAIAVGVWGVWAAERGRWDDEAILESLRATGESIRCSASAHARIPESRTTLVGASVHDRLVQWASFGDSSVWSVDDGAAARLNPHEHYFLGWPMTFSEIAERAHWGECGLGDWLVLCSDGVSEFVADETIAEHLALVAPEASAREVVEGVYRLASAGGAGDNVAVIAYSGRHSDAS